MAISGRQNGLLFDVWKGLAKNYQALRSEAENENRRLCDIYARHAATIDMLRRLLQLQAHMKSTPRFSPRYSVHSYVDPAVASIETTKRLHGGLGQLYRETDHVLLSNGLSAITSPSSQTNVKWISDTISHIEFLYTRIIPFGYKDVGNSFWHEMTKNYVASAVHHGKSPQEAKVAAVSQAFTLGLEEEGYPVKIQFCYAGKRIADPHREVLVLSGENQMLEAFGALVSGVDFEEKHWLVLSELSPGVTLVKVCMHMTVHFSCELPNRQNLVGGTCQLLSNLKHMGFESVLQGVEQRLLVG
ncbi:hypothetical protein GN244_ATG09626 [Phytophthora infestans]|uniref:Uncharacterized protein n=1 Tax=Phytophthora infestans TaxID=4787 RepID=A0A833T7M3_PHYIN|nr:hypothetical protein GN244_ATG09626 [Phytophthora infestans]